MSFLINLWSESIMDPIKDINDLIESVKDNQELFSHINGLDNFGLPILWSPILLLMKQETFHKEAFKLLMARGANIDQAGKKGFNALYILLMYIFQDKNYINHLEWWLNMGANPNAKIILGQEILTPLEFFLHLYSLDTWKSSDFLDNVKEFECVGKHLEVEEVEAIIYTFLCYGCENPEYNVHPIFERCKNLHLNQINKKLLKKFPILEQKLCDFYKMPSNIPNFWTRHLYLSKKFNKTLTKKPIQFEPDDIVINPYFSHDYQTPKEQYIFYLENNKNFYFISSMIPKLIQSGTNPCTNIPIPLNIKQKWMEELNTKRYFPYKTLDENKEIFPLLFSCPEKPKLIITLSEMLHKIISKVHPYTSIINVRQWKSFEIEYTSSVLNDAPYLMHKFKDVVDLEKFLLVCMEYIYKDAENTINKLHFGIEDISEDLKVYYSSTKFFAENSLSFQFSFFEAMLHTDIYNLLKDRIGYYSFYDMGHLWYKICTLCSLENDLSEDTDIVLIQ